MKTKILFIVLFQTQFLVAFAQENIPKEIKKMMQYYPQIVKYNNNKLFFSDSTYIIFNDSIENKTFEQILNKPDIKDQFQYIYNKGKQVNAPHKNEDAGRIRNETFFKKIYGENESAVAKNLIEIIWCPKLIHQKILVTKINGIDKKIAQISQELDQMPQYKRYFKDIAGTHKWRKIKNTNRMSMHSFGIAIDINFKLSNYWQFDYKTNNENIEIHYENKIPQQIIDIFEKYGFIWGGKWYHYDTMHFEYRPELL